MATHTIVCMARPINFCTVSGCTSRCVGRGFCRTHYMRWKRHGDPTATPRFCSLQDRFWRHVNKTDSCWLWLGAVSRGYGHFVVSQRPTKTLRAHRYSYELLVGQIPEGLTIDHLCRNRLCVNPDHLEPVTMKINVLRNGGPTALNAAKTHCLNGHPFDQQNTHITPKGLRRCRMCERNRMRLKRAMST